jgi:chromosome partitioning protein
VSIKIAVMSMKGGQAKTSLSVNLAARIAKARRDVLLIDSDVQANVTTIFQRDHVCNLANLILGRVQKFEFIELDRHFYFLPSGGTEIVEATQSLAQSRQRETFLRKLLEPISQGIVIVDTAPSWSDLSRNLLMYVDYVIVPVVTDYLGYSGCDQIMNYISQFQRQSLGQCQAEVLGIAITRYNTRTNLSQTIRKGLQEQWPELMFSNLIEETVSIQEAPAFHQNIFDYRSGRTRGAYMYDALCKEIMKRIAQREKERRSHGQVA